MSTINDIQERQRGSSISRGELWVMLHKKKDGSFIHDDAQVISVSIVLIKVLFFFHKHENYLLMFNG